MIYEFSPVFQQTNPKRTNQAIIYQYEIGIDCADALDMLFKRTFKGN